MKPRRKLFHIGQGWDRLLAVGCSHGDYLCPVAADAVCRFRDRFAPDYLIHLGDIFDTRNFRSGAAGTADEAEDVAPDLEAGDQFLRRLRPTHIRLGNHDDRLWKFLHHPSGIVRDCASRIIRDIYKTVDELKAQLYPYAGVFDATDPKARLKIGDYLFVHGTYYGENAIRQHAEAFGNTVHAHIHRTGAMKGRRGDNPTGLSVGTLANIPALDYAKTRGSTLAWNQGFVWGYVSNGKRPRCQLYLHEQPRGETEWVLPL
jgi:predicted phosphodiesterase